MKNVFFRLFATLLYLACAAVVTLPVQAAALQQALFALARPTTGLVGLSPSGALLRSTDSGATWTTVRAADSPQALYTVAASGSTVIAMGDAGFFVRSTDNGVTWSTLASSLTPTLTGSIRAVAANGSNWVAVGQRGTGFGALRSSDNGATWSLSTSLSSPTFGGSLYGVVWSGTPGSSWIAVGGDGARGYTTTSTDGTTWTALVQTIGFTPLRAVTSSGSGTVIAVGDAGAILQSTNSGTSFTSIDSGIVSEDLRSVAFLSGSNWVIGGASAVLVSVNGTTPAIVSGPSTTTTTAITALISDGTATGYDYYSAATPPAPHGPITLGIALVSGQLQLTLVGAEAGNSYYLETSTTLTSWTLVADSMQAYSGGTAPTWSAALSGGDRTFYRARSGTP